MALAVLTIFYLLSPIPVIYLCRTQALFKKIGAVFICYVLGACLGNIGLLPQGAADLQDNLSAATVALALPLLLFPMDVGAWGKSAGKAMVSMAGAFTLITAVSSAGCLILSDQLPQAWKLAGLTIGVYTGGTPNMAAIRTALDVDPSLYITLHTYDIIITLFYLVFCLTIAQKVFNRFLPPYRARCIPRDKIMDDGPTIQGAAAAREDMDSFSHMLTPKTFKGIGAALILSCAILGTALGLSTLAPAHQATAVTILAITTLGIGASFIPRIRAIPKTFQAGMYLILCFCIVVGSMARIQDLATINWALAAYLCLCIGGTFILHALFCRLMSIDTDTFIITSVAAICSPPFVPVVAAAMKNKEIILSGLTTGIIGYAVGNYLGIGVAHVLKTFIG
ncbi:MAG: DUF819 family protein [Desulfovibrionales bacterium]|nr:DUF819 family protein [Desulfovibrionales bacterium]